MNMFDTENKSLKYKTILAFGTLVPKSIVEYSRIGD